MGWTFSTRDLRTLKASTFTSKVFNMLMTSGIATYNNSSHGMTQKRNFTFHQGRKGIGKRSQIRFLDNGETFLKKTRILPTREMDWILHGIGRGPNICFRSDNDPNPPFCLQWHNVTLPLPAQCFTVSTHSRCLTE
jgi:hypothetical protein